MSQRQWESTFGQMLGKFDARFCGLVPHLRFKVMIGARITMRLIGFSLSSRATRPMQVVMLGCFGSVGLRLV